jgi:nitrite reductase/ring-hydroxylating ferredoxin subunit
MPKETNYLCKLTELTDPDSRGFSVKIKRTMTDIFIVRQGDQVYGYENTCPHAQAPLEWNPDQFLDENNESIICALHGAKFGIEKGECLGGPCNGIGLTRVELACVDNKIYFTG